MKRLDIALILLAGSIFIQGLAGAADSTFGTKNLPYDSNREWSGGFMCQPSYSGDCANRPSGTYCIIYSDGYIWEIPDSPARGVWDKAGYWHGQKVEVIHGKKADYYHVLGTPLIFVAKLYVKENYENTGSNHNATQTAANYPQTLNQPHAANQPGELNQPHVPNQPNESNQPQAPNQPQGQVALIVYVHEGDFNGTILPGVQITGQDAAGNSFKEVTDSTGAAVIEGQPGAWEFSFAKEGYETLDLDYNVTQTDEAATYLLRADTQSSSSQSVPEASITAE